MGVDGGNVFFYNEKTGEFQWERPVELVGQPQLAASSTELEASPWCAYKDPGTGMAFWHNHETGESQWERPEGIPDMNQALEELGAGGTQEAADAEDARDLREVHDLSD